MNLMKCLNCGKEITKKPCQYCGSDKADITIKVHDFIIPTEVTKANVVNASSEVTIESQGKVQKFPFVSGVSSDFIASTSLYGGNLSGVTPTYLQQQIINNINNIEKYVSESKQDQVFDEHSFEINLGVFKYKYKRSTKKS